MMKKIIFATGNEHKMAEIRMILMACRMRSAQQDSYALLEQHFQTEVPRL